MEGHVERIVHSGAVALDADVGRDGARDSEQDERLIQQVGPDVEPHTRPGLGPLAPGPRLQLGPEAIEMRFADHDAAEGAFRQQSL